MKELRCANNLVQSDVAKILQCTQVAYGMYELGKRRISIENLVKLAKYYHVSLDYLQACAIRRNELASGTKGRTDESLYGLLLSRNRYSVL